MRCKGAYSWLCLVPNIVWSMSSFHQVSNAIFKSKSWMCPKGPPPTSSRSMQDVKVDAHSLCSAAPLRTHTCMYQWVSKTVVTALQKPLYLYITAFPTKCLIALQRIRAWQGNLSAKFQEEVYTAKTPCIQKLKEGKMKCFSTCYHSN